MPQPEPEPDIQSQAACGAYAPAPVFTEQYVFGFDIFETYNVWVYKFDAATGSLTEMPYSPMQTYNHGLSAAANPAGKHFYITSETAFGSDYTGRTLVSIETYNLSDDDSAPLRTDLQESGYSRRLHIDPQGKFFHTIDNYGRITTPGINALQAYSIRDPAKPVASGAATMSPVGRMNSYTYKAEGNFVVVNKNANDRSQPNTLQVYREDCRTGAGSLVSEMSAPFELNAWPVFISAPLQGDLVVGWYCGYNSWQYRVDKSTGSITPHKNLRLATKLCDLVFDPSGKFAVGTSGREYATPDTVVLYRVDATEGLIEIARATMPLTSYGGGETIFSIALDHTGKFLLASSVTGIGVLAIDPDSPSVKLLPDYPKSTDSGLKPILVVPR